MNVTVEIPTCAHNGGSVKIIPNNMYLPNYVGAVKTQLGDAIIILVSGKERQTKFGAPETEILNEIRSFRWRI